MKPKKLIRDKVPALLKDREYETIEDKAELNALYVLKIKEELNEIQLADHKDVKEFADLLDVVISFALVNGFFATDLYDASLSKVKEKGMYTNIALNNLNPNNPSNKLYFENKEPKLIPIEVPVESERFFINDIGCLRHTRVLETGELSSVVEPEVVGEYLEKDKHELVGWTMINKNKYVLYKSK